MQVATKELRAALSFLKPVCGKYPVVKIIAGDSELSIKASLNRESALERIGCDGDLPAVYVDLNRLLWAVESSEEKVSITTDGTALIIKSKAVCRVPIFSADTFVEAKPSASWTKQGVNCLDLAKAIDSVAFCAATNDDRFQLMSIHVMAQETGIFATAADGRRAARLSIPAISSKFEMLVPSESRTGLVDALRRDGAVFSLNENAIMVQHSEGQYATQQIEGPYLNTEGFFKPFDKQIGICAANSIRECVQILQGVTPVDPLKGVWLVLSKDETGLRISNDHFDQSIAGEFELEKLKFDAKYFQTVINAFKDSEVNLAYDSSSHAMSFESGNLKVVVASQRI